MLHSKISSVIVAVAVAIPVEDVEEIVENVLHTLGWQVENVQNAATQYVSRFDQ